MGAQYIRGGIPRVLSKTATTTVQQFQLSREGVANFLHFENRGANDISLAFSAADMTAGNTISIPTGSGVIGNPLSLPLEVSDIWVKTAAGTSAFVALALIRRG